MSARRGSSPDSGVVLASARVESARVEFALAEFVLGPSRCAGGCVGAVLCPCRTTGETEKATRDSRTEMSISDNLLRVELKEKAREYGQKPAKYTRENGIKG